MVEILIKKRSRSEAVVTQRKFFKKTARGKVIKGARYRSHYKHGSSSDTRQVLRERYLRDDVGCGIEGCGICPATTEEILPASGDRQHKVFPKGHFVLPDTNVFLAQMDLIESNLFTPPIILLQTVIEEVRHRSLPLYNRLKAIVKTEEKRVWVFYNEYRSSVVH